MPAGDQGMLAGRYSLVPRTLVFLTRGSQVLLIKGAAHKRLWAGLYNAPGGHIERGEDILSSARREVLEETGLVVSDLWVCGMVSIDTSAEVGILIFVLRGDRFTGELTSSPEGEVEWVEINRIDALPLVEDLPALLPKVLRFKLSDPPFSAHYTYDPLGRLVIRFAD